MKDIKNIIEMPIQQFPNGFESWQETHYEMVQAITLEIEKPESTNTVWKIQNDEGSGGLYILAKVWTDEFETLHKGKQWGVDDDTLYFDAFELFIDSKRKI